MKRRTLVGTVGYPAKKERVRSSVDLIELTEGRRVPPGRKAAKKMERALPDTLNCTVQLSRYFVEPPEESITLKGDLRAYGEFGTTEENMGLWKKQGEFAKELKAKALVMITPARVTPQGQLAKAMSRFLGSVERGGIPVVWEPHGPWEREQVERFAKENDLIVATDPLRDEVIDGDLVYFRLGPFAASGSRMGTYDLERIADAAGTCRAKQVFCLFETQRALEDAVNLKKILSGMEVDEFDY